MKTNFYTINIIIIVTLLITHNTYVLCMIIDTTQKLKILRYNKIKPTKPDLTNIPLLPQNCINLIIAFSIINQKKYFKDIAIPAFKMRSLCKACNNQDSLLITIGKVSQNYYCHDERDFVINRFQQDINSDNYQKYRKVILFLTYADAHLNEWNTNLLQLAINLSDTEVLERLLSNNTSLNHERLKKHTIFSIKTIIKCLICESCHTLPTSLELIEKNSYFTTTSPLSRISDSCKTKNTLLITIGKLYQKYHDLQKINFEMNNFLETASSDNYWQNRKAALFLTYAGARNDAYQKTSLLQHAIWRGDTEMLEILFNYNTSPNQKWLNKPNFFSIQTIHVAQIFMNQKTFDRQATDRSKYNVLWECIHREHSPKLIEFYINNNVSPYSPNCDRESLLHYLCRFKSFKYTTDNYLNICRHLIKKHPEIINNLNIRQKTPLDLAEQSIKILQEEEHDKSVEKYIITEMNKLKIKEEEEKEHKNNQNHYEKYYAIIALLKNHGGKTSMELKTEITI